MIEEPHLSDLARAVLAAAGAAGLTVVTVESCTGGLVAAALTAIPGSSSVVDRGFVTYSNGAKHDMVGVPMDLIAAHGAVSEPVAAAMATGALAACPASLAVSVTGIAGPGGSEFKPEGRVCFAIQRRGAPVRTLTEEFGARGRDEVRGAAVHRALELLLEAAQA
ncbi:MAG: nicotinamide-nucleotide amidase [Paracoccaceae bacterium]|jgi:nicotinamide-nucleotide amidase